MNDSPASGDFIDEDTCGREIGDGICGKAAEWRIQLTGTDWDDAEATACDEHVDEAARFPGTVRVYRHVDRELWSQLYGWLGDRTAQVDGDGWEHGRLQRAVRDLVAGPLAPVLNELAKLREAVQ